MTLERQLEQSWKALKEYPFCMEELQLQLHLLTTAIKEEAEHYNLPYEKDTHIVKRP